MSPTAAESMYPDGPSSRMGNEAQSKRIYKMIPRGEYDKWLRGPPEVPRFLHRSEHDLNKAIETNPDGFLVYKNHPQLKDIENNVDIFSLPKGYDQEEDFLFARPKAVTS